MSALITTLIDKQDTFEIVRDQIAAILAIEIANQQVLATADAQDPDLWKMNVYLERSNPWEQFLGENPPAFPIVNVWYDTSNFNEAASNIAERQDVEAIYNIDCYGYAKSADDGASGHLPGDREAALQAHKALRLVRNILMSAPYIYLALRGTVGKRWTQGVTSFQPELDGRFVQNVTGARLSFRVRFNEFAPQVELSELDLLSIDVLRTEDGQIVMEADYNYTLP